MKKGLFRLSALGLLVISSQVYAAGYRIEFQSASVLADSGEAAVVEDAGTNWYNAAGLTALPLQVVMSGIDVYAPTIFTGTASAASTVNMFAPGLGADFIASGKASSHPNSMLPAFHLSMPVSKCIALGLSVVPAWGFTEDYGEGSLVRYNLTRVYTKTIMISPSIAFQLNPEWSVGVGPDANYFSVQSKTHIRTEGTALGLALGAGTVGDSSSRFTANDWAYGGHIGILYRYSDTTRFGLNYRSKINMHLDGDSDFTLDQIGFYETNLFHLPIALPASTTFSIYHDMSPCWALMGTIAYDQWSSIKHYHARNYIQPPVPPTGPGVLIPDVTLTQDMRDTIDIGIGTHYKLNDKLMLRANFKYEQTPVRNEFRNVNFPDAPKYGVQIGARYQVNCKVALDFIYGHVFTPSVHIHDVNPVSGATATGHNNTSIDLMGGQLVWNL